MDHPQLVTQGLVERVFVTQVGVDFEVGAGLDTHRRRPLADVPATVVGQVQAAMKGRAGAGGFDQALGHAAAGLSAEFEVEIPQFAGEDLCIN